MSPTISIVIPAYNAAATILKTLDSVFQQTFSDFEVLVINDGSTDQTLVPKVQVIYRQSADSATSNIEVMEYYLLLLINRTFESVPQELKPLKKQSISWVCQYIAEHYLKSQKATLKQLSVVGINLCKTIYLHPPHLLEDYTQCLIRMFLKQLFLRLVNKGSLPQLQKI